MLNWVPFCVIMAWGTYINKSSIILFMWSFIPQDYEFTVGKDYGFHLTFSKEGVYQRMLTQSANEAVVWSARRSPHTEEQKLWWGWWVGAHPHHQCQQCWLAPSFPWPHMSVQHMPVSQEEIHCFLFWLNLMSVVQNWIIFHLKYCMCCLKWYCF